MIFEVRSPLEGTVVPLSEVPDPVFAQAMVGPGVAVEPARRPGDAVSPVDGRVVTLHAHAFVVATGSGPAVLVHLGIDTVKLKGEGFTLHAAKGDTVRAGQPLVSWDPVAVAAAGYSPVSPVIALDGTAAQLDGLRTQGLVAVGEPLFSWRL